MTRYDWTRAHAKVIVFQVLFLLVLVAGFTFSESAPATERHDTEISIAN